MFFMPMLMTYNQQQAHAAIISKPLQITAKKVAKELAQESAVAMAEHILFEKAINEFINSDYVDQGYSAVCLDGPVNAIEDCAPQKRAQVKTDLTSTDKSNLSQKVEQVLEQKTNTSSKWAKFLDWFIPIFLVSGLVAFFTSMMDSDSEGFIDDIAQQSLIDSGLLKTLNVGTVSNWNPKDFTPYVQSVSVRNFESSINSVHSQLTMQMKSGKTFELKHNGISTIVNGATIFTQTSSSSLRYVDGSNARKMFALANVSTFNNGLRNYSTSNFEVFRSDILDSTGKLSTDQAQAWQLGNAKLISYFNGWVATDSDLNNILNTWFSQLNTVLSIDIMIQDLDLPPVKPDWGIQTGIDKIKDDTGNLKIPGIDSFDYTDPVTKKPVYPSNESSTGWKDKTTGEDIAVNVDDIIVDGKNDIETPPIDPEEPPKEEPYPKCEKDLDKIEFKKVGTAFTYAFPFSIPWDVKRYIDAAFGGVGSERPSFALFGFFGDARIELPAYFDNWMPFLHGALVLMFDLSLIYLFYRFMGRGGD